MIVCSAGGAGFWWVHGLLMTNYDVCVGGEGGGLRHSPQYVSRREDNVDQKSKARCLVAPPLLPL